MRTDYESRLIKRIDKERGRSIDTLFRPFKLRFEPAMLQPMGIDSVPREVRQYFCIHGIPYLFKDTRNKCKRCSK